MPEERLTAVFNQEAQDTLTAAIEAAEMCTSGELRLHIEARCKEEVLDRAAFIFEKLGMHQTAERSGVLFYFALLDHKFAILGDAGINAKVPEGFWEDIKNEMRAFFVRQDYLEGLSHGIRRAGEKLALEFPKSADNPNELSNEISFGCE